MLPPDHLVPLARVAEEAGYASIAVPDSVFFPEETSGDYPFTEDGSRWWAPETPFVDPFVAVSAMAPATERIRFFTNVVKLPLRDPLLVAKQVSSIATLSHDRFAFGVGLSWIPEEFIWTGTEKRTRGARTDEAIEIIRKVCAGGGPQWVEHHGKHYEFGRLMISPAPERPVPILVGGHSEPAMRRAARLGDGWISANVTEAQLRDLMGQMRAMLAEEGRAADDFEVNALAVDVFDIDGFRRLGELGVTEAQVVPWFYYGGDPNELQVQIDALHRFAETVLHPLAAEA